MRTTTRIIKETSSLIIMIITIYNQIESIFISVLPEGRTPKVVNKMLLQNSLVTILHFYRFLYGSDCLFYSMFYLIDSVRILRLQLQFIWNTNIAIFPRKAINPHRYLKGRAIITGMVQYFIIARKFSKLYELPLQTVVEHTFIDIPNTVRPLSKCKAVMTTIIIKDLKNWSISISRSYSFHPLKDLMLF